MNRHYINSLPPIRQLLMDIDSYERKYKQAEAEGGWDKTDLTLAWMEVTTRKDHYKALVALPYESIYDIKSKDKDLLEELFYSLDGQTWRTNFGWLGQPDNVGKITIEPFEGPASVYDGLFVPKMELAQRLKVGAASSNASYASSASSKHAADHEGYIANFDMQGNGCFGEFPNSLNFLVHCEFLNLNWNVIFGPLTAKHISSLTNLRVLQLAGNGLTGCLDANSFQRLTNLVILDLSFNAFFGDFPDIFQSCNQIEKLSLQGNAFTGPVPPSLQHCTRLMELRLFQNQFSGELLESTFAPLKLLKVINLSHNQFTKGLDVIHQFLFLEYLQLNHNRLKGRISGNITGLKHIKIYYVQNNELSGILPSEMCTLTHLKCFNVSNNHIRGLIPQNIGNLSHLEVFLLHGNNIIGPVPLSIQLLQKLKDFAVFRSYPSELTIMPRAYRKQVFEKIYVAGPQIGINSMHWDYYEVYGLERNPRDDDTVTIFSGKL